MTSAIETALTELSANLRRMEQRHQAVGYKFDRLYGLIDAAREELGTLTRCPAQEVPAFCHVASLKLKSLQERGYQITGYALEKPVEGAQPERGFINDGGFVGWWWEGQSLGRAQTDEERKL